KGKSKCDRRIFPSETARAFASATSSPCSRGNSSSRRSRSGSPSNERPWRSSSRNRSSRCAPRAAFRWSCGGGLGRRPAARTGNIAGSSLRGSVKPPYIKDVDLSLEMKDKKTYEEALTKVQLRLLRLQQHHYHHKRRAI